MTRQEAIKILEMFLHKQCDLERTKFAYSQEEIWNAVKMATEALKKYIPKKVEIKAWATSRCPSCDEELATSIGDGYYRHPTFLQRCPNVECCQRLKWSEEDD